MALARVKTWIAGDVLTAADLNGEFNNVLNNPVALISPSTGVIDFNLQAHKNLIPGAISASSATAGNALIASTAATPLAIWGAPTASAVPIAGLTGLTSGQLIIGASSGGGTALGIGSTGQVLSVTSSNTNPVWGVIPLSGGLTSGAPVSGNIFYVSTSGVLTPLAIGTSAQVLTVSSGLPVWAAAAAAAGGTGSFGVFSSVITAFDDFYATTSAATQAVGHPLGLAYADPDGLATFTVLSSIAGGVMSYPATATTGGMFLQNSTAGPANLRIFVSSYNPDMTIIFAPNSTSTATIWRIGLVNNTGSTTASLFTSDPTDGIYWRIAGSSTCIAVVRKGGTETIVNTTGVATSSFKPIILRLQVTSSGTGVTPSVDGTAQAILSSANITSTILTFGFGHNVAVANTMRMDGWIITQDRMLTPYV